MLSVSHEQIIFQNLIAMSIQMNPRVSGQARRKNLLAFACLFTFYACLFIFCACLFTFFLGANHKAPTFHVTLL